MAPDYEVDPSPLLALHGERPVADTVRCALDGVLGAALVVSSRKGGFLVWGHGSLRIVACAGGAVVDREYETYRLGRWNLALLAIEHEGAPWLDGLRPDGGLVLFRNADPVDAGWFGQTLATENRDVLELWLPLPPDRLERLRADAEAWYDAQTARFAAGEPPAERYVPWARNCTEVWRRLLPELDPGSSLPYRWLRAHEDAARLRVLHPAPATLAHLEDWSARPRPHHVFRRAAPLPDPLPDAAIGPWTTP